MHSHMYAYAMTKVISLSEKAYQTLSKLKKNKESFSDIIMRIASEMESRPLTEFAGKWEGSDADEVFERVLNDREEAVSKEL